ncbi:flagellin [Ciceribacter sp. L1K22]|uniref:flagellin N-terminal helical domain-containing protein n=1 Tax=Ciceribacter sp. L1K22 TaxID=2820275 RepID=UPI001ABED40E|nr:flagellin [Ciceribacter sp. L1K22]MBO3759423.1 flagellin [Ciceribacter sp. L1K22]
MTSILTNIGAMSALQTLRTIAGQMQDTQRQVSTGMRVEQASDNAAYWSISTTMHSDNMALAAVEDALGLGGAKVDTAYAGMTAVVDVISEMKSKIVVATEDGVDRYKVQAEIEQLKEQLTSIVSSATFSGENWLSTDGSNSASVVASATRDASGNFGVKKISVNLSEIALFTTMGNGLLQTIPSTGGNGRTYGGFENFTSPTDTFAFTEPFTMDDGDEFKFDIQDGALLYTATVTKAVFDQWAGPNGVVDGDFEFWDLLAQSAADSGPGFYGVNNQAFGQDAPNPVLFSNFRVTGVPEYTIMDVDVTDGSDLGLLLSRIDGWLEMTIDAAADLGALQSRISMQSDFVAKLTDSIDSGIGRLVDADMNEASTRLKALQTQEQLAIQSLSIANTSADSVLTLFR